MAADESLPPSVLLHGSLRVIRGARLRASFVASAAAWLALSASSTTVTAQPADTCTVQNAKAFAGKRMEEGNQLRKEGQLKAALAKYMEAKKCWADPVVDLPIAITYEQMGEMRTALVHYQRALSSRDLPPSQVSKIKARIDELKKSQAAVTLLLVPSDAQVIVDGDIINRSNPRAALPLAPGRHTIELSKEGYEPDRRVIEVTQGRSIQLKVILGVRRTSGSTP